MHEKYSLSPTVIIRSEPQYYDTFAAFDYSKVRTEFLEKREYLALEYISGKAAEIGEICRHCGMNYSQLAKFIKRMRKRGYIRKGEDAAKIGFSRRITTDPSIYGKFPLPTLSAPVSIDVFITSKCNLNCVHCFAAKDQSQSELPLSDLKSIFDQVESLGVFEVRITGGEPLLHANIDEILADLQRRRFRKVILTNGILLDDRKIGLLRDAGVIPTISLDDSVAEDHDLFRGVGGSFDKTIAALKRLQKNGSQYGINCCLHRRNLRRHREIIELAVRYGASRIAFLDLKPSNRLSGNPTWIPNYDQYVEVMPDLQVDRVRYGRTIDVALDSFLHCAHLREYAQEAKNGFVSCQAGRTGFSIDSDGSVYPCNIVLSDPRWRIGQIREKSLADIWFSTDWLFFRGGVRIEDLVTCRDCKDRRSCKDFYCRLLPSRVTGDVLGPHPRCAIAMLDRQSRHQRRE